MALLATSACDPPDAGRAERLTADYLRIVAAEDARPDAGPDLELLVDATSSQSSVLRAAAVRALGRLENPELIDRIEPLLDDAAPTVRAEAANALAQAVHREDGDEVATRLIERAPIERDTVVLAALARSIGRSASSPTGRERASRALLDISRDPSATGSAHALLGVALGWESLVRGADGQGLSGEAATRLFELASLGDDPRELQSYARIRAVAYSALGRARRLDRRRLGEMLEDGDPNVRLLAGRYMDAAAPGQRPELTRRLLMDRTKAVTIEGLLRIDGEPRTELYCRFLMAGASSSASDPIRVVALDALDEPCPELGPQVDSLTSTASGLGTAPPDGWQPAAHALLALSSVAPYEAEARLDDFVDHANPFVRAYAARAATRLRDRDVLRRLAADDEANVRTAAVRGLYELDGHTVDDILLAQLDSDDPQLLMTAAELLEGSRLGSAAAGPLADALARISEAERETWRDPRMALLERIAELGDATLAPRLEPYVTDYDPQVAIRTAELLTEWTGRSQTASLRAPPREPLPTPADYRALEGTYVVLHMRAGGAIVIQLEPFQATTNVFRFARLVREGYFDGLTFHRWVPNFVIQGGSPGANEYQGAGRFTRDEVGLQPHWRGTVGISTRGRDTGDAQIFVNLIDNVRLDHDYTIVGRVVGGMEIVDTVLEGWVIERAELVRDAGAANDLAPR